ncbi:putative MFS family arabinose efflux permease [Streptomyces sp. 1114.5]|uniref:MFS transporter n=1 Tax=unclassified Streptomyces TaxID=2593676 RepID=UPI000BD203CE|nr:MULTISPECIES: MFS transporter [unclassified Streptomyces]RKT09265.1 putative MFS family arabinose efflux permease [Streptomyces sp. 1114.5]SOB88743.1 Predicted arabinose efflux permease, MFS family [Streptomyces sp. 1331.2]
MSSSAPRLVRRTPGRQIAARHSARRHGAGFWLIASAFVTAMAFSTVPTPLYPLYQARDGFSTFTVTVVFAVYALGVLASLLLAGHISDWLGRRKVLITALTLELAAAALFLTQPALPLLLLARLVTGLGVGMLTATATAHLHELHTAHRPDASPQRFEIVSTAANIGGLGFGPLIAGLLAQYLGAPLRLPYLVFGALLLISIAAVALTPETVQAQSVRPAYRPQRISTDHGDPAGYLAAAAAGFASFAVFGLFTSLAPGFVGHTLHHPSRALAGLTVFAVFGASAAAQTLTSRLDAALRRNLGLYAQAAGTTALAVGMHTASLTLFLVAGITAGIGAGVLFKSAVGTVVAMATPAKRGEALAGLFLISYLGLALPAIAIGIATRYTTMTTAMTWFTAALLALLTTAGLLARRPRHTD